MVNDYDDDNDKTSMLDLVRVSSSANPTPSQTPYLIVVRGVSSVGKMFKLSDEMLIGRAASADIFLDDEGISRRHARLLLEPNGTARIIDLGSTNGLFVDGKRVTEWALRNGDKIQIGGATVLKFSYQDSLDEALQRNLYESATRDGLTRLYNKRHFEEVLRKECAYRTRHKTPLSLLLLDVDFFKTINDTHGHPAGDMVLQKLSHVMEQMVRAEDTLARYGGEEFALILHEAGDYDAMACAERIRRLVETTDFIYEGQKIPVTVSVGVATLSGEVPSMCNHIIETADRCLYLAKQGGRNRTEARRV